MCRKVGLSGIEKRIITCGQESGGDGGTGEKKEGKTEAEMVGQHQELVVERIGTGGSATPS